MTSPSSLPVHSPTIPRHSSNSTCPTRTRTSPTPRIPTAPRNGNATLPTTPSHNQSVVPISTVGCLVSSAVPWIALHPLTSPIVPAHRLPPVSQRSLLSLSFLILSHLVTPQRHSCCTHPQWSDGTGWHLAYIPHMYLHHTYITLLVSYRGPTCIPPLPREVSQQPHTS